MDAPAVLISAALGLVAGWFVVVPVVERIPERMPLELRARVAVAIVNALLWAAVADKFVTSVAVAYMAVFSALLAVSVVDLRLYRIPDRIVFPSIGIVLVLLVFAGFRVDLSGQIKHALVGAVAYFAILFTFHIVYPRGMGFGDVKLALLMGLSVGWLGDTYFGSVYLVLISLFLGCLLGIVFGIVVRLVRGRGGAFPFGPALALATVYVVMNFQNYLV